MIAPAADLPDRVCGALAAIDEHVAARLERLHAPGVVVGVTDRELTLGFVCGGVASLATRTPVDPDTRFQIGSISKSFAAAALLQEREAGRVDLDAPVTEYVPWFAVRSRHAPITLHHLLSHTSGLPMGTELSAEARHALWSLRETEPGGAPGEHFLYSNDGYKLVGLALEAVAGRPAERVIAERIVAPLGMTATETTIRRDSPLPVSTGYQGLCDDRPYHAGRPLIEAPRIESCTLDGSIVSSATDLLAYARLILNRGDAPAGRLLSDDSFALWTRKGVEDPDEPGAFYGYGLVTRVCDGYECIGHSGGMLGFTSLLLTEAQTGVGVIVLLNGLDDRMETARFALQAPPADPTFLGEAGLQYAGAYLAMALDVGAAPQGEVGRPPMDRLVLIAYAGQLRLRFPPSSARGEKGGDPGTGGDGVVLERRGDDLFLALDPEWDVFHLRFERDAAGAVVGFSYGPWWFPREGCAPQVVSEPDPSSARLIGTYRSGDPWAPVLRVISRRGRLLLVAPWLSPVDELDLVPLPGGGFRVGTPEWLPDRLAFDTVIDGRATRAVYDGLPFYRTFT
jgi:D-alanyl-D-alanine carboxypeptidase